MSIRLFGLVSILVAAVVARSSFAGEDANAAGLRLLTFNTGLAHGVVPYAAERRERILDALRGSEADLVCLQEVWRDEDVEFFKQGLAARFPHSFSAVTSDPTRTWFPKCAVWSLLSLKSCVDRCRAEGRSAFQCIEEGECQPKYDSLSDGCKLCLSANTGEPIRCATAGARRLAYDGRNGLLLLSATPLESPTYDAFPSELLSRGQIVADVQGRRIQCTHLAAELSSIPYPTGSVYRSWGEEQAAQVDRMASGSLPGCRVIVGDMNASPKTDGLEGEHAQSLERFRSAGFESAWADPPCTFCADNPLAGVATNNAIDHVFSKGCKGVSAKKRIFTEPIRISAQNGEVETRLSDHYGVFVALE